MLKRDRSKGFTLIELLLVIAILGIIAGIAVPALAGQRRRARVIGDATSNAKVIQMALETRRAEMGAFGKAGDYTYKSDGTRPTGAGEDIIPGFTPKGNSKMDFKITIGETGLTYLITVTDPAKPSEHVLKADQTGGVETNKKY